MLIESTPTEAQFRNDLLPIYPDGDLVAGYNDLKTALESYKTTPTGESLTWSYILKKFKDLHDWWQYNYGPKDQKYLKDRDREKRVDICEFIRKEMYNQEFTIRKGSPERDRYLFGEIPIENLKAQLDNFRGEK